MMWSCCRMKEQNEYDTKKTLTWALYMLIKLAKMINFGCNVEQIIGAKRQANSSEIDKSMTRYLRGVLSARELSKWTTTAMKQNNQPLSNWSSYMGMWFPVNYIIMEFVTKMLEHLPEHESMRNNIGHFLSNKRTQKIQFW